MDRTSLAKQLKRKLLFIFPKAYMQKLDFEELSMENLVNLSYLVRDIENLEVQASRKRRLYPALGFIPRKKD